MIHRRVFVSLLAMTVGHSVAGAEEGFWNQFRGPNGDGNTHAKDLPIEFGESQNVRWKTAIHGKGYSSPHREGFGITS